MIYGPSGLPRHWLKDNALPHFPPAHLSRRLGRRRGLSGCGVKTVKTSTGAPARASFTVRGELFGDGGDTGSPLPNQAAGVLTKRFREVEGARREGGTAVCPVPTE